MVKMTGKKSKKNKISFDEECDMNKISAKTPTSNVFQENVIAEDIEQKQNEEVPPKKRRKNRSIEHETSFENPKVHNEGCQEHVESKERVSEEDLDIPEVKPKESIRERKRKKHAQLLEMKKSKVVQDTQQSALNYLSKWKHARDEWKFEKLKQIWLSENLFDSSKLPDDMWPTAVEYFSGSKGFIRKLIMREALKVVDAVDLDSDDKDDSHMIKLDRARDIVQHLN